MKIRDYFDRTKDEGEIFAEFGNARIIRYLDGGYELRGGSNDERLAAKEWISMFCHDVVVREV